MNQNLLVRVYEAVSGERSLKYIVTPQGRAIKKDSTLHYGYNLKALFGNVRIVLQPGGNTYGTVVQSNDYFPFRMA
ncbi:MAG: hypothetical protein Q8T08_11960, partial [Ignavibacteria bacterium]|nr:hypothetical protein [Ignavibacteria bacterium]